MAEKTIIWKYDFPMIKSIWQTGKLLILYLSLWKFREKLVKIEIGSKIINWKNVLKIEV